MYIALRTTVVVAFYFSYFTGVHAHGATFGRTIALFLGLCPNVLVNKMVYCILTLLLFAFPKVSFNDLS